MVCADTSKRRGKSSTLTPPKARGVLRISDCRWLKPGIDGASRDAGHRAAVCGSGQRGKSGYRRGRADAGMQRLFLIGYVPMRRDDVITVLRQAEPALRARG